MTLHFHWLHAPQWLRASGNRAMTLVLGVIGVSLLFTALRVLDVAFSGAQLERHAAVAAPAASVPVNADLLIGNEPPGAGAQPIDTSVPEVPEISAQAISL